MSDLLKKEDKILKREWKNILFNSIFGVLTVLFPVLFYKNILLTTLLLSALIIFALIRWKSKLNIVIFVFGAIGGVIAEMVCIHFGVWKYSEVNFFNIPLWLFVVWGNTAVFIYQTALEFKKLGVKK